MAVYHEHLTGDDVMGTASFRVVSEMVPFLSAVEDDIEEDLKGNGNGGSGRRGQEGGGNVDDKTPSVENLAAPNPKPASARRGCPLFQGSFAFT